MQIPAIVDFAQSLIDLADLQGCTPVVSCDKSLKLRRSFYQQLLAQLAQQAERPVRIEILHGDSATWWLNWHVSRFAQMLESSIRPEDAAKISVERRLMLSRPAGATRPLAVGFALRPVTLPEWAQLIELTTKPTCVSQVEIVAA